MEVNNWPPIKEIALAVSLLIFGTFSIVCGIFMSYNRVGGDRAHRLFFAILGSILFILRFYYTRIAYYAYKGYKGFSFATLCVVSTFTYSCTDLHFIQLEAGEDEDECSKLDSKVAAFETSLV